MTIQRDFHMPQTGEAWRHSKGSLYTIIGLSRNSEGHVEVVYTEYRWSLQQLAPIYNQPLGRFLQEVQNQTPRFRFEREPEKDEACQYIRPRN